MGHGNPRMTDGVGVQPELLRDGANFPLFGVKTSDGSVLASRC